MSHNKQERLLGDTDRTFARAIAYFRAQKGMTRRELADRLGVSHQQFQKYEHGINRVTVGRAVQIAAALDVPLPVLIGMVVRDSHDWSFDRDAIRLMRSFQQIHDRNVKRQLTLMVEALADSIEMPERK